VSLALDGDGQFLAFKVDVVSALGAYISLQGPVQAVVNIGGIAGQYRTPAISANVRAVFINTTPITPYRGAGRPEASYAIERAIDLAATDMGIDRIELRRRNMIAATEMPFQTGLTFRYDCGRFEETMDHALSLADYAGFPARQRESEARKRLRGIGIANAIEQAGRGHEEYAQVRIESDGSATVLMGTNSHGQGHETVFRQIVSERLGLSFDNIRIVQGDTDRVAYGRGTFGSRSASNGGSALVHAIERIIEKGRMIAAGHLEAGVSDIVFEGDRFKIAGTDKDVSFEKVAQLAFNWRALPPGVEPGLDEKGVFMPPAPTFPNGTHVCEVEIDPETGVVEILRYAVVDDVGTVVNPLLLEGQIHGGIAQGVGQILMEQVVWDRESGQLVTGSFMDYAMPRAGDLPSFAVGENPVPTSVNPLGVKGAGEAGAVGALPCVMSAILDALRPLQIRNLEMPATPERIWRAISRAIASSSRNRSSDGADG
jgi:carbon-monoxide dehydrogenase large subunit